MSSKLWGLGNIGQNDIYGQVGIEDIDIDVSDAWNTTKGNTTTVFGVIDTGIDFNHPDLAGRIWTNLAKMLCNGKDDDGNGYIEDVNSWDFFDNDNTVFDAVDGDNHGIHVAGTIAADLNNNIDLQRWCQMLR